MKKDILINDSCDLVIQDGDFVVGDSVVQNAVLIINTAAGAWKRYPTVGVGIRNYSGSTGKTAELKRKIVLQLTKDGYSNIEVDLSQVDNGEYTYNLSADLNE